MFVFVRKVPSLLFGCHASRSNRILRKAYILSFSTVTKTVDRFASIKICSNCQVKIKPYNIHECPDGNLLRVSLRSLNSDGSEQLEELDRFKPSIVIDGRDVTIDTKLLQTEHLDAVECLIEVPVAANLSVTGERNVSIENSLCDSIRVSSTNGNIATKSVRSKLLELSSANGNIDCNGMTIAQNINIRTSGKKGIRLEKVQGIILNAITENGSISTEACYAVKSKFTTTAGKLRLKNIHMTTEIRMLEGGDLDLTGFHGTLNVKSNAAALKFQLAEISGKNCIEAKATKSLDVNISDLVEESAFITANVGEVILNETLSHLVEKIVHCKNHEQLVIGDPAIAENPSLTISSDGPLALGKLSWIDSFSIQPQ